MSFSRGGGFLGALALSLAYVGALLPSGVAAFSYPALDTTSHWTIQNWGFSTGQGFHVQGAAKNIWLSPGQPQSRTAFYSLSFPGARLNGNSYHLQAQDYMGELQGEGYLVKYGSFRVTADVNLNVVLFFYDDGKFEANSYFSGSGYAAGSGWEVIARIDYDMAGSGNNVAEFLWNPASEGYSLSPPQAPQPAAADGRLNYSVASHPSAPYWAASAHEISVAYPPLARTAGPGIENLGFARILNAANPEFGMVLWGGSSPIEATFKIYAGFDGNLTPNPNVNLELQLTADGPGLPRYAYGGRDQMLFLRLGQPPPGGAYVFGGKLFQRGESRSLSVTVHQHPAQDLGGWDFDPDMVVRYTDAGGRTFRNALSDLTGPGDLAVSAGSSVPYLPYGGFGGQGEAVTEAQLHALMSASRTVSQAGLENVRDWRLDLFLVNWTLQGEPDVWEVMFDYGGADGNGIVREGAAVLWPALLGKGDDYQRRQSVLSALRATGLALNMDAAWGTCPFVGYCWNDGSGCGGRQCGGSCPSGASGCRYSAFSCEKECVDGSVMSLTDFNRSTLRFNHNAAAGSGSSELDWYRFAPEAWVKPGRFGAPVYSGPLPHFVPD